jgi:cytochrome P450
MACEQIVKWIAGTPPAPFRFASRQAGVGRASWLDDECRDPLLSLSAELRRNQTQPIDTGDRGQRAQVAEHGKVRPMPSVADAALLPPSIISPDDLPQPAISERDLGTLALLRALRTNGLATYSTRTYTETRLHRRLLGRDFFLLSDPADIDHVLNRPMDRYRRDPLGRRVLEPTVGRGVLLAEGAEWRRQRYSLAPAFQPRYVDRLIPAFHEAAARRIAQWDAEGVQSRNLLIDFRALTLAIAARAMFSIEDDRRTAELAKLMNEAERQTLFLHATSSSCCSGATSLSHRCAARSASGGGAGWFHSWRTARCSASTTKRAIYSICSARRVTRAAVAPSRRR